MTATTLIHASKLAGSQPKAQAVRRIVALVLLVALTLPGTSRPLAARPSAQAEPNTWVDETLARMTPADRVGQLFLVVFESADVSERSEAARLVQEYRVGGVLLSPAHGNLDNLGNAASQAWSMTRDLQQLAFSPSEPVTLTTSVPMTLTVPVTPTTPTPITVTATVSPTPPVTPTPITVTATVTPTPPVTPTQPITLAPAPPTQTVVQFVTQTAVITFPAQNVPLLIAVSQEGDGWPHTALRGGLTELPSNMAVGATWNPQNAEAIGSLVGEELAGVGINLLLGPSLDVLDNPRPGLSGDLGTRSFGGDPYWVSELSKAYIRGVHLGSTGQVATVAKHLPGLGASDRSQEEEIATVDKSLQELRRIELPPFLAATASASVTETTDALMTAHIRYRGFQGGNIRAVTKPISVDAAGIRAILEEPEFSVWRENGGVLVSDSLGVPAVRRYYDPGQTYFPHKQVALDAFLAGNDVLLLSRFALTEAWPDQMRNIQETIRFFQERYESDPAFAERVDESVRRILQLKHKLYPTPTLEEVQSSADGLQRVGEGLNRVIPVAQGAVSLLYPSPEELGSRLPRAPRFDENIVIFTDAREVQECPDCPAFHLLQPDGLRETMITLYGPDALQRIDPARVTAFTFEQLTRYLDGSLPALDRIIGQSDWILFAILDHRPTAYPESDALKRFLQERTDSLEGKQVVVLAYSAPYYLDTTEINKLTAYYGVYSRGDAFIEASIRVLFQEYPAVGSPPVDVASIGYDLTQQLAPDPDQVIAVVWADQPDEVEGTAIPIEIEVGDILRVRTGVILDRNGHPVPDNTPVQFIYAYADLLGGVVSAVTVAGVAEAEIPIERAEELRVRVSSEPARNSDTLLVVPEATEPVVVLPATSTPTPTPTSTNTPTPTPTPTDTPTPTPTPTPEPEPPPPPVLRLRWIDFWFAVVGILLSGSLINMLQRRMRAWDEVIRTLLWGGVGGLLFYVLYGINVPGSHVLQPMQPGLRGLLIGLVGGLFPLARWLWHMARRWRRQRISGM
jgi:beta-N-acetylhexosaminidase